MVPSYALFIPVVNEADSAGRPLHQTPRELLAQILAADNGSQDSTAEVAQGAGAQVVREPRRGYGQACLTGLGHLEPATTVVVFMDADLSDERADLERLVRCFEEDSQDLVVGSCVLGNSEPGSLTPVQRLGNWLTAGPIRWKWPVSFTDLGPLRIIRREALECLPLRDGNFGWNVEMQAKTACLGPKMAETLVNYHRRRFGRWKISGTVIGSAGARAKIHWTMYGCWRLPRPPWTAS